MIEREEMKQLIRHAKEELAYLPKVPLYVHAKEWVDEHLRGRLVAPHDRLAWPKGCLALGLLAQGEERAVLEYYARWQKKKAPVYLLDDMLIGQAFLQLGESIEKGQKAAGKTASLPGKLWNRYRYDQAMHKMMAFLYAHEKDAQGSLPYRPLHKNGRIFADGIGMVCPFACAYGVTYRDREAVKLALRQVENFFRYGLEETTGLPYHVYSLGSRTTGENKTTEAADKMEAVEKIEATDKTETVERIEATEKIGLVGWGRGVGWIVYGLAASLEALEKNPSIYPDAYGKMAEYLTQLLQTVSRYVTTEGLFASSLTEPEAPADTSASAMILYGFAWYAKKEAELAQKSAALGNRGKTENPPALSAEKAEEIWQKGKKAMEHYVKEGAVLQAQSECLDIGVYGTKYGSYPWSVGMTLKLFGE